MSNSQKPYTLLLVMILLAGGILRFWNFWNMPFTFDELSAMSRTTYDSFSEMIRVGVVEKDSHPAGIQTFLYYWVMLFGDSEFVVKLPFLLSGLASIWLAYKIGVLWFNPSTGIITAAYISSLQFFILYSQVARPYSSGLMLTLTMVWFWGKYFFDGNKGKHLVLFVVFGALSAYNHYISLLFVATVGLSGLFFVNRKNVLHYTLSGVAMFLLYLPHLSIFFAQAEKGTIGGWLGQPGKWFILEFFHWLFHYSYFSYGLFLAVLIGGMIWGSRRTPATLAFKKRITLFLWLLPAPIFGYIYSYTKEPILQFSLLIFTAPYIFILVFSFLKEFTAKQLTIIVGLLILINSLSLIITREHYRIFYKQPFEQVVEKAIELEEENPGEVYILNNYIPYYSNYYFRKYNKSLPYYTIRNQDLTSTQFDSVVAEIRQNNVITSGLPADYFLKVKKHFPVWREYDFGFTYEQYTYYKGEASAGVEMTSENISSLTFSLQFENWEFDRKSVVMDSSDATFLFPMQNKEWGPLISFPLDSVTTTGYSFIDIEMDLRPDGRDAGGVIVAEIKFGELQQAWRGFNFKINPDVNSKQKANATLDIQVMLANHMDVSGRELRIYIWNPKKTDFYIDQIQISRRPGNPIRYALYSNFSME